MPALQTAQEIYGYLPIEVQTIISDATGIPLEKIYGVATFYAQFALNPKGRHRVSVCLGTACYVKGAQELLDTICEAANCKVNETSPDGLFSVDATRCLGACGLAPVAIIDGKVHGNITDMNSMKQLIQAIKASE